MCSDAVRYAFAYYHILSEGSAVIHDGGALLFSSEDLTDALKEVRLTYYGGSDCSRSDLHGHGSL